MKEIVLDTETTGLSVRDGHRIVEIGCIELDNLVPTKNIFHVYLNPERKVSEKAFEVHGYTDEFLSTKQKFVEIAKDFLSFIEGKKIIIHNAEFDIGHLNNELSLIGLNKGNIVNLEIIKRKKEHLTFSFDLQIKDLKNFTNLISQIKQSNLRFKIIRHKQKKNAFIRRIFENFKRN